MYEHPTSPKGSMASDPIRPLSLTLCKKRGIESTHDTIGRMVIGYMLVCSRSPRSGKRPFR